MQARLRYAIPSLLFAALALPATARAVQIVHTDGFTIQSGGTAIVGFQEFNPALGTLDKVSVFIDGTLNYNVVLAPSQLVTPRIDIDASGAAGRGFDFALSGATLQFAPLFNISQTSPGTFGGATNFSISFELTSLSDLTSFVPSTVTASGATATPPSNVAAQRSDFVLDLAPIGIFETLLFTPVGFSPLPLTGGGLVALIYDYTPAAVAAVPVAPAGALFVAGIAALGLLRRRGKG